MKHTADLGGTVREESPGFMHLFNLVIKCVRASARTRMEPFHRVIRGSFYPERKLTGTANRRRDDVGDYRTEVIDVFSAIRMHAVAQDDNESIGWRVDP